MMQKGALFVWISIENEVQIIMSYDCYSKLYKAFVGTVINVKDKA